MFKFGTHLRAPVLKAKRFGEKLGLVVIVKRGNGCAKTPFSLFSRGIFCPGHGFSKTAGRAALSGTEVPSRRRWRDPICTGSAAGFGDPSWTSDDFLGAFDLLRCACFFWNFGDLLSSKYQGFLQIRLPISSPPTPPQVLLTRKVDLQNSAFFPVFLGTVTKKFGKFEGWGVGVRNWRWRCSRCLHLSLQCP